MLSKKLLLFLFKYYKDLLIRLQPEPSNASGTDEPKSSVADSVMIDNQVDYDKIFRAKARLPRSPSHQGVSPQPTVPSSSSAGFTIQTPSTTEVSSVPASVAAKPKTSQSVSPPPQVILCLLLIYL
jgi:hypothetical protein